VVRTTGDVTEFRNGASLEIATNDARLVRGRSAIAVLGSECCHWKTDEHSASSDEEVVGAAEPSMAMCPDGGLLLLGSSVYRQKGYMFRRYRELFGNDESDDLCWFAPTPVMNPKFKAHILDKALAANPSKARAEYLNVWRTDLEEFLPHATSWAIRSQSPIGCASISWRWLRDCRRCTLPRSTSKREVSSPMDHDRPGRVAVCEDRLDRQDSHRRRRLPGRQNRSWRIHRPARRRGGRLRKRRRDLLGGLPPLADAAPGSADYSQELGG